MYKAAPLLLAYKADYCYTYCKNIGFSQKENRFMENLYQGKSSFYKEGRLGYSEGLLELISQLIPPSSSIADIGSGTGIFSAALLEQGYKVYCVEPSASLQQQAEALLSQCDRFIPVLASAESTSLAEQSVEAITVASAYHWFEQEQFLRECQRIIKPNGYIFLIYNIRKSDDLLSLEQKQICQRYCPDFSSFHHGADKTRENCSAFFQEGWQEALFPHDLTYSKEQFLSRCLSSSYSPPQSHPDYPAYRQALEKLIEKHAENELITVHNYTACWYGKVKAK